MLTFLRDILIIFIAALLVSFLVKTYLIRSFYIPSGSMENTLMINDRVIVNELVPKYGSLHRGDVIVFTDPGGWLSNEVAPGAQQHDSNWLVDALSFVGLSSHDGDDHLIKRVIGLPGDTVACCDSQGHVIVNGTPIEEPYVLKGANTNADAFEYSVKVPKGKLWVLGDNRYNSADSALHHHDGDPVQFVPESSVVGRAVVISWPLQRWKFLDNYSSVFAGTEREESK